MELVWNEFFSRKMINPPSITTTAIIIPLDSKYFAPKNAREAIKKNKKIQGNAVRKEVAQH